MSPLRRKRTEEATAPATVGNPPTPIAEAAPRQPVRGAGQVMRMRARPTTGIPALAVTVSDDTGSVIVVWTGRRSLGGLALGRRVQIEGVAMRRGDTLEFTNPAYTLLP